MPHQLISDLRHGTTRCAIHTPFRDGRMHTRYSQYSVVYYLETCSLSDRGWTSGRFGFKMHWACARRAELTAVKDNSYLSEEVRDDGNDTSPFSHNYPLLLLDLIVSVYHLTKDRFTFGGLKLLERLHLSFDIKWQSGFHFWRASFLGFFKNTFTLSVTVKGNCFTQWWLGIDYVRFIY